MKEFALFMLFTIVVHLLVIGLHLKDIVEQMEIENDLHKRSMEIREKHWGERCE